MNSVLYVATFLTACLCLFSGATLAQSTSSTPSACNISQAIQINQTAFEGTWYEVARNPAPASSMSCVTLNIFENSTNLLWVNTTFAPNSQQLNVNRTITANITMNQSAGDGYNLTYHSNLNGVSGLQPNITLKVLAVNYTSYALVCGYTNSSDMSTSFALVLTRSQFPGSALLGYEQLGANYSNFGTSMPNITQSTKCYTNAATTQVPILSALFALFYALYKILSN